MRKYLSHWEATIWKQLCHRLRWGICLSKCHVVICEALQVANMLLLGRLNSSSVRLGLLLGRFLLLFLFLATFSNSAAGGSLGFSFVVIIVVILVILKTKHNNFYVTSPIVHYQYWVSYCIPPPLIFHICRHLCS